jgi:N-acetylglucosamine-6-sulfatase
LIVDGPHVLHQHVQAIAQNVDLAPTFERLAGAEPPADVEGRSLVGFLHGRPPRRWRGAALVEHHRPIRSQLDPDLQGGESGNPPTYAALRTKWSTYVEYVNGDREFYDDRTDPDQLRNAYGRLSPLRRRRLHHELRRMLDCHGAAQCVRRSRA